MHLDTIKVFYVFTYRRTLYQPYKTTNIYTQTYKKTAATCFGLRSSSGGLHLSLAKVTFIKSVGRGMSLWTLQWCGSMLY